VSRLLCTFPGRAGDLLWALPTVRAISEAAGHPVDLQIAWEFAGMVELLQLQPYLRTIYADTSWSLSEGWRPPTVAGGPRDQVIHLGYRRWPELALPQEIYVQAAASAYPSVVFAPIDLDRPWITKVQSSTDWFSRGRWQPSRKIAVGFTECHFELKYGLFQLLDEADVDWQLRTCMGRGRWMDEAGEGSHSWREAAALIEQCEVFFGDCSALHVLACALGKPCVLVEPMEARHNSVFYPYGMDGPQVRVVKGLDGRPTFDARHTAELLREVLGAQDTL
jgi:hypothetical protein